MKSANQNEIDVLLRSLGRRDAGVVSVQREADEHLDADELSAFAEGSVTEGARARYYAHLSECSNCRGIVVSLTESTGFAAPRSVTQDKAAASFWRQLTAFFSQPALRFVIPAIVLVSIIGIGVIALRQDQPSEFVAQHDPSQQPTNLDQSKQAEPSQSPPTTESAVTPAPTVAPATPVEVRRGESPGSIAGVGTSERPTIVGNEAVQPSEATPTFAPDVAAAAPPPAPAYAERDRAQTLSRQEAPKREVQPGAAVEAQSPQSDSVSRNKAATTKTANNQPGQSNAQGLMRENRAYEDKDKNDASGRVDAKTISGKRFIRRNNSWIDSAYHSMATTNVKRGSEQYRALIADEPGLRAFAEQLSGEVIVVWKGRAYRFH